MNHVKFHAHDSHLYMHCQRDDIATTDSSHQSVDRAHGPLDGSANRLQMNPCQDPRPDCSGLVRTTTCRYSVAMPRPYKLQLGSNIVTPMTPSNHVRVLGVTISSDLSLGQHVPKVCAAGFYRLRQLRSIRKSLDKESPTILVHDFVTSSIDYCNPVYALSPCT